MIQIARFRPNQISNDPNLLAQCKKLTLPGGMMWPTFRGLDLYGRKGMCWIAFDDGKAIGWCLRITFSSLYGCQPQIMVYVKSAYRRQGIGGLLVKRASSRQKERVVVFPWNKTSQNFFRYLSMNNCNISHNQYTDF